MEIDRLKKAAEKIKTFGLDMMFPIRCLGCSKEHHWLCKSCFSSISFDHQEQACPVCERKRTPDGKTCFSCRSLSSLDGLLVCSNYGNKLLAKTIHSFKYKFIPDLHEALGKLMLEKILLSSLPLPDIIIPVPLHKKRLRWRGFNQSELLAGYISNGLAPCFPIPVDTGILSRQKNTPSQMKIKEYLQRKANISGAFSVSYKEKLEGKSVLLVDDVATTGSTIFECAKTLKESGAKEIFAVVIARQKA